MVRVSICLDFCKLHFIPVGQTPIKLKRISGKGYADDQVQSQAWQLRHNTSAAPTAAAKTTAQVVTDSTTEIQVALRANNAYFRSEARKIKEAKDQMQRLKHGDQDYSKVASEHLVPTVCVSVLLSDQVHCFRMLVTSSSAE